MLVYTKYNNTRKSTMNDEAHATRCRITNTAQQVLCTRSVTAIFFDTPSFLVLVCTK